MKTMNRFVAVLVGTALSAIYLIAGETLANTMDDEIDYLLKEVARSGCTFIRNGKRHSARDASAHLKSKWRHNAHLIDSTEEFIEKIASKSSISGKPYRIRCRGQTEQTTGEWLSRLLEIYKDSSTSANNVCLKNVPRMPSSALPR